MIDIMVKYIKDMKLKDADYICIDEYGYMFIVDNISIKYTKIEEVPDYMINTINKVSTIKGLAQNEFALPSMYFINNLGYVIDINTNSTSGTVFNSIGMTYYDILNIKQQIFNKWYNMRNIIFNNLWRQSHQTYLYDNIQNIDTFKEIFNMKAYQGAKPFIIDNHIIWLFKGLIPNNKTDKIDLCIYDYTESLELFDFVIHKKKYQFGMMMLCLKMN